MMTKRKSPETIQDISAEYLIKPKKQFEADLIERISIGEEFLVRPIKNALDFESLSDDYSLWHDFNKEFLKRSFNRTMNQYYKDYAKTGVIFGSMRPPTLQEKYNDKLVEIKMHIKRLNLIKGKLILLEELPEMSLKDENIEKNIQKDGLINLEKIFSRFHRVSQTLRHRHSSRDTIVINDEYDVQDLVNALLQIHFLDIRPEEYSSSYAGANSRIDFVLTNEDIVIEIKMTNDHLKDKDIGSQLLVDIGRYKSHPNCKILCVFVYDKEDHIRNKVGLKRDLENMSTSQMQIKIFIEPQ